MATRASGILRPHAVGCGQSVRSDPRRLSPSTASFNEQHDLGQGKTTGEVRVGAHGLSQRHGVTNGGQSPVPDPIQGRTGQPRHPARQRQICGQMLQPAVNSRETTTLESDAVGSPGGADHFQPRSGRQERRLLR